MGTHLLLHLLLNGKITMTNEEWKSPKSPWILRNHHHSALTPPNSKQVSVSISFTNNTDYQYVSISCQKTKSETGNDNQSVSASCQRTKSETENGTAVQTRECSFVRFGTAPSLFSANKLQPLIERNI